MDTWETETMSFTSDGQTGDGDTPTPTSTFPNLDLDPEEMQSMAAKLAELGLFHPYTTNATETTSPSPSTYPQPGKTFLIRDPKTNCIVYLKRGILRLQPYSVSEARTNPSEGARKATLINSDTDTAAYWHCIQNKDLWLGFQNEASGGFIGRDKHWKTFIADAKSHQGWEHFCVRQEGSGHVLLARCEGGFRAMKVRVGGGQAGELELVVAGKGEAGTVFEFVRVGSDGEE
ncbi:hypothetical protein BDW74DRAFT_179173 [Aspergillus multicolor]|uniref:uncharacterized protein n=1 Tax=Aspergillus multicolor TaxID=41759 RepID=UPI003CCCD4C7